jgi:hypothetical protein
MSHKTATQTQASKQLLGYKNKKTIFDLQQLFTNNILKKTSSISTSSTLQSKK